MIELTEFFLLAIYALSQRPSDGVSQARKPQSFRYLCALTHFTRRPPDGAPQNPQRHSGLLELTVEFLLTRAQYPPGRVSTELLRDSIYNSVSATLPCLLRCSATSKVFFLSC